FRRAQSVPLRLDALLHCRAVSHRNKEHRGRALSRHCGRGTCGQSGSNCTWSAARATWPCSILRSTASCAVATSWRSGWTTWRPTGTRSTEQLSARENGSARPLRADRGHTSGAGRLPAGERPESGTILVPGPACPDQSLTTVLYPPLAYLWMGSIGLDRLKYANHSMGRTKATLIYCRKRNLRRGQPVVGPRRIEPSATPTPR